MHHASFFFFFRSSFLEKFSKISVCTAIDMMRLKTITINNGCLKTGKYIFNESAIISFVFFIAAVNALAVRSSIKRLFHRFFSNLFDSFFSLSYFKRQKKKRCDCRIRISDTRSNESIEALSLSFFNTLQYIFCLYAYANRHRVARLRLTWKILIAIQYGEV